MDYTYLSRSELEKVFGISRYTTDRLIQSGKWLKGIHFFPLSPNSKQFRYHKELILDYFLTQENPGIHQETCEEFLKTLPSNRLIAVS